MPVGVTVLQLDTSFPRIPGDIGCAETFACDAEIIRIPQATVAHVVRSDPMAINIAPFEAALHRAKGEVITTSCGFLAPWQDHLQSLADRPVITSALSALATAPAPEQTCILTFDADKLNRAHLGPHMAYAKNILGLRPTSHLRRVIEGNLTSLDPQKARTDLLAQLADDLPPQITALLFECTNLPPYRAAIGQRFGIQIIDLLTCIEDQRPHSIRPDLLAT